jgi:hypothetical protein
MAVLPGGKGARGMINQNQNQKLFTTETQRHEEIFPIAPVFPEGVPMG